MGEREEKESRLQAALRKQAGTGMHLDRIFQEHSGLILQAAYRVTGNLSDAEDVLQTIFLRLLRRGYPSGFADNLGSYLHRAAVNASIDLIRGRGRKPGISLEELSGLPSDRLADSPEHQHRETELADWLRGAVSQLSTQAAEAFVLRYLEGYQNQEIADLLGTSPGVVAVVLHRSRQRLREELKSVLGAGLTGEE